MVVMDASWTGSEQMKNFNEQQDETLRCPAGSLPKRQLSVCQHFKRLKGTTIEVLDGDMFQNFIEFWGAETGQKRV